MSSAKDWRPRAGLQIDQGLRVERELFEPGNYQPQQYKRFRPAHFVVYTYRLMIGDYPANGKNSYGFQGLTRRIATLTNQATQLELTQ